MIVATVNIARVVNVIRQFPASAGVTMATFLHDQARILVSSSGSVPGMVQVTPPHSQGVKGAAAKKQGEAAVKRDIARVYASPSRVYAAIRDLDERKAAAYWKAVKAANFRRANEIAKGTPGLPANFRTDIRPFDDGAEHRRRRGKNGRVGGLRPTYIVSNPQALWKNGKPGAYVKKRMGNVGLLASSIPAAVGGRFGKLKGVPAWASRHSGSWGICRVQKTRGGETITLGLTKGAQGEMQRRFNAVLGYRMNAIKRQLPHITRKLEQRLQGQLR